MSGTWGNVVRNVVARKWMVDSELRAHNGRFCAQSILAGMGGVTVATLRLSRGMCRTELESLEAAKA